MADLLSFPPASSEMTTGASPQVTDWRSRIEALPEDKDPCPGYRHGEWSRIRTAMLEFLATWGEEAARLGWTTEELLAVNSTVGVVRADGCGSLVSSDRPVTAVEPSAIVRGPLRWYRGQPGQTYGVPIWGFVWPKVAAKKLDG